MAGCPVCGFSLGEADRYCRTCGSPVGVTVVDLAQPAPPVAAEAAAPPARSHRLRWIAAVAALAGVVGVSVLWPSGGDPADSVAAPTPTATARPTATPTPTAPPTPTPTPRPSLTSFDTTLVPHGLGATHLAYLALDDLAFVDLRSGVLTVVDDIGQPTDRQSVSFVGFAGGVVTLLAGEARHITLAGEVTSLGSAEAMLASGEHLVVSDYRRTGGGHADVYDATLAPVARFTLDPDVWPVAFVSGRLLVGNNFGGAFLLSVDGQAQRLVTGWVQAATDRFVLYLGCDAVMACGMRWLDLIAGTDAVVDVEFNGAAIGSPDGASIVMPVTGSSWLVLSAGAGDGQPRIDQFDTSLGGQAWVGWDPAGTWVALRSGRDLDLIEAATGRRVPLTLPVGVDAVALVDVGAGTGAG